ncbi:MAG: diacylglycerol kinase [Lactobacillaceae bacterium]|jgi:diacylglycerol kinase (ATP)|nr:diacylglycerol kinase [Lactobacillaceae bacterium]
MTKRARVIYNPTSGREGIKDDLLEILSIYEKAGYETSAYATTPEPFSARDEATRAALDGFDLVAAAGGDGTVNEVINGISGLEKRPKVAIIPAGTTNDFARALGIPRDDLVDAAKVVLLDQTMKMDIGHVTGDDVKIPYFMNIAALGTLSEITYSVPSTLKSLYGYLAYVTKGAELITKVTPVPVKIEYDGGVFDDEASLVFVALTNSVGGFEKIVPDAKLNDGKFSLLIIKKTNIAQLFALVAKALSNGSHVKDPLVTYVKTSNINISTTSDQKMKVNLDGEYGGDVPVTFTNLREHIEFVAPAKKLLGRNKDKKATTPEEVMAKKAEKEFKKEFNDIKK